MSEREELWSAIEDALRTDASGLRVADGVMDYLREKGWVPDETLQATIRRAEQAERERDALKRSNEEYADALQSTAIDAIRSEKQVQRLTAERDALQGECQRLQGLADLPGEHVNPLPAIVADYQARVRAEVKAGRVPITPLTDPRKDP